MGLWGCCPAGAQPTGDFIWVIFASLILVPPEPLFSGTQLWPWPYPVCRTIHSKDCVWQDSLASGLISAFSPQFKFLIPMCKSCPIPLDVPFSWRAAVVLSGIASQGLCRPCTQSPDLSSEWFFLQPLLRNWIPEVAKTALTAAHSDMSSYCYSSVYWATPLSAP